MTFERTHRRTPVFCWLIIDIIYREFVIASVICVFNVIIGLIKTGQFDVSRILIYKTLLDEIDILGVFLCLTLPVAVSRSFHAIRGAVVRITINHLSSCICMEYYNAWSLFLKKRIMIIPFAEFGYYIENSKEQQFFHLIYPSHPEIAILVFQKGKYRLKMNCNIGWTRQQFAEIIKALNDIVPPDDKLYVW